MSTAPQVFDRLGQQLRVVLGDAGEPLFVAADVATILGYRIAPDLTRTLDDDEKGTQMVRTPGGQQRLTVITEAGLYRAILNRQSGYLKDDRARGQVKAFQRWVTHEVLPTIRRTGSYAAPAADLATQVAALSTEQWVGIATQLTRRAEIAEGRVAELTPAARAWDTVTTAAGADYSVAEAAKILTNSGWEIGQTRLFTELQHQGWIFRRENHWQAYQRRIEQGVLAHRIGKSFFNRATGEWQASAPQVRVTAKGVERLLALYQEQTGQLALPAARGDQ